MQVATADALVAQHAVGRSELGHDQAASAQVLDEAAEDGVGDAGHGGEDGGGGDADVADLQGRWESRAVTAPRPAEPRLLRGLSQNFCTA